MAEVIDRVLERPQTETQTPADPKLATVAVVGLGGYFIYQETHKPALAITVDKSGIQVQGNG